MVEEDLQGFGGGSREIRLCSLGELGQQVGGFPPGGVEEPEAGVEGSLEDGGGLYAALVQVCIAFEGLEVLELVDLPEVELHGESEGLLVVLGGVEGRFEDRQGREEMHGEVRADLGVELRDLAVALRRPFARGGVLELEEDGRVGDQPGDADGLDADRMGQEQRRVEEVETRFAGYAT